LLLEVTNLDQLSFHLCLDTLLIFSRGGQVLMMGIQLRVNVRPLFLQGSDTAPGLFEGSLSIFQRLRKGLHGSAADLQVFSG